LIHAAVAAFPQAAGQRGDVAGCVGRHLSAQRGLM
jgi:hypothetical protein